MGFKRIVGITADEKELFYYIVEEIDALGIADCVFTARKGGVSKGGYSSLNLAFTTVDSDENIIKNRQIISQQLGLESKSLIYAQQTHGDKIHTVSEADAGRGALAYSDAIPDVDALMTDKKQLVMGLGFADCVPVFAIDKQRKVLAVIHSGWKGTATRIVDKTISAMVQQYGSRPSDLLIAIGPSIRSCCYTVGKDVRDEFSRHYGAAGSTFFSELAQGERWSLDMQAAIIYQAVNSGVLDENIIDSAMCTCCLEDDFFSHRRDGGVSGRMNAIARLR